MSDTQKNPLKIIPMRYATIHIPAAKSNTTLKPFTTSKRTLEIRLEHSTSPNSIPPPNQHAQNIPVQMADMKKTHLIHTL